MKKVSIFSILILLLFATSCGSNEGKENTGNKAESNSSETSDKSPSDYDPKRGEGKFNADNVKLGATVDAALAKKGEEIQGVKCSSCHKLTDEKLVGPGWKGVTTRKTPYWIMNFITNPDPMIDKDPEVQSQLEICLVRMPNQNLTDDDARALVEFMRKNDQ